MLSARMLQPVELLTLYYLANPCFLERLDSGALVHGQLVVTAVYDVSSSLFVDDDGRNS
jgi:hypothetical protein